MSLAQQVKGLGGEHTPSPLGHRTVRLGLTTDLETTTAKNLFGVLGGDILMTGLYGRVTTEIGAGNAILQLQHTPTIGAVAVDLCAVIGAHIGADIVDTMYSITGAHGDAMVTDATAEGVAAQSFATNLDILVPGIISLDVTGAISTGIIRWVIHWVPLDPASRVVVL